MPTAPLPRAARRTSALALSLTLCAAPAVLGSASSPWSPVPAAQAAPQAPGPHSPATPAPTPPLDIPPAAGVPVVPSPGAPGAPSAPGAPTTPGVAATPTPTPTIEVPRTPEEECPGCRRIPLAPPLVRVVCGADNDELILPEVPGADWHEGSWRRDRRTVLLVARPGRVFATGVDNAWTFHDSPEACPAKDEPAVTAAPVPVARQGASRGTPRATPARPTPTVDASDIMLRSAITGADELQRELRLSLLGIAAMAAATFAAVGLIARRQGRDAAATPAGGMSAVTWTTAPPVPTRPRPSSNAPAPAQAAVASLDEAFALVEPPAQAPAPRTQSRPAEAGPPAARPTMTRPPAARPAPTIPTTAERAVVAPPAKVAPPQPAQSKPAAASKPAGVKPAAAKPGATKPTQRAIAADKPVQGKPAERPVQDKPAPAKPVQRKPVQARPTPAPPAPLPTASKPTPPAPQRPGTAAPDDVTGQITLDRGRTAPPGATPAPAPTPTTTDRAGTTAEQPERTSGAFPRGAGLGLAALALAAVRRNRGV